MCRPRWWCRRRTFTSNGDGTFSSEMGHKVVDFDANLPGQEHLKNDGRFVQVDDRRVTVRFQKTDKERYWDLLREEREKYRPLAEAITMLITAPVGAEVALLKMFGAGGRAASTAFRSYKFFRPAYKSALKMNYAIRYGVGAIKKGHHMHHIIPKAMLDKVPALRETFGFAMDGAENGYQVPSKLHGSHKSYNKWVETALKEISESKEGLNYNSISSLRATLVQHMDDAVSNGQTLHNYFKNLTPY
jgi:hypothetical protein